MDNIKTDQFIFKAKMKHGDLYDYSKTVYVTSDKYVTIICKTHGEFSVKPHIHLNSGGCRGCAIDKSNSKVESNIIAKSRGIHGDAYDYSLLKYVNRKTKIKIICKIHGIFEMLVNNHIGNGCGCPRCSILCGKSQEQFISDAILKHPEYDYSKTIYINNKSKIIVTCRKHGEFQIRAGSLLSGNGCKKCYLDNAAMGKMEFVSKAIDIHGDIYDYSDVVYVNNKTLIDVICPKHGAWKVLPDSFLDGHGCKKCYLDGKVTDTLSYVKKANLVHAGSFDHSRVNYINSTTKIEVCCNNCGKWSSKLPSTHLNAGCSYCNLSKQQLELLSWFAGHDTISNDRNAINNMEIDIYIPKFNLGIEFHGLYWHSYNRPETKDERWYHYYKYKKSIDSGIKLIQIFEHEFKTNKELLKSMLKHHLKQSSPISARKLKVREATDSESRTFYAKNHIQGYRNASVHLCLYSGDTIFMMMSFLNNKEYYSIQRMATAAGYCVRGGASRLLSVFIDKYHPKFIVTFADLRYSSGIVYEKLGFDFAYVSEPNYFYYKSNLILSRQKCQKHRLHKILPDFDAGLSESQNMFNNGYRRVWDAGHMKFVMNCS